LGDELSEEELRWDTWLGEDRRNTMALTHLPTGLFVSDEHHDWALLKRRVGLLESLHSLLRRGRGEPRDTAS
jgi:hypothetical protein